MVIGSHLATVAVVGNATDNDWEGRRGILGTGDAREYGLWSRACSLHRRDERMPCTGGHAQYAAVAILGVAHHDRIGGTGDFYALATVRTRVAGGTPVACCLHSRAPSSIRQRLSVPRSASVLSASNRPDSSRITRESSKT